MSQWQTNETKIKLYMTCRSTKALGPYERYAIWVQGCTKRCPGCISPDAQPLDGGYTVEVEHLVREILSQPNIEGITISGGEPFLQQAALCELIEIVRSQRDMGVIVYTGMLCEEIAGTSLAKRCDLVIDGEYIEELNDDLSLRGSSNQRVICITDRYADMVDRYYGQPGRKIELILKDGRVSMVGIPGKDTLKLIK